MQISAYFKRAWLRRMYRASIAAAITLLERIEQENDSLSILVEQGQTIASTSGNGHSVSFSQPGAGAPTQTDMLEMIEEMIIRHEEAVTALAAAGNDSPTDLQILNEMLALLQPVREVYSDYSGMRQPSWP